MPLINHNVGHKWLILLFFMNKNCASNWDFFPKLNKLKLLNFRIRIIFL